MEFSKMVAGDIAHNALGWGPKVTPNFDRGRLDLDIWQEDCQRQLRPGLKLTHVDVDEPCRIIRTVTVVPIPAPDSPPPSPPE